MSCKPVSGIQDLRFILSTEWEGLLVMAKVSFSTRLTILIGTLSSLLLCIGGIALFGIVRFIDALKVVYEDRTIAAGLIAGINRLSLKNRLTVAGSLIGFLPNQVSKPTDEFVANMVALGKA